MKILALILAVILACAQGAAANTVIVQQVVGGAAACVFTNTPQNGNVIFISRAYGATTATTSVTDSNSVALTNLYSQAGTSTNANAWYYVVSGSPGKTYSFTSIGGAQEPCYELGGATTTGGSPTSTVAGFTTANPWTGTAITMVKNGMAFCGESNTAGTVPVTSTFNGQTLVNTQVSGKFGNVSPNASGTGSCSWNYGATKTGIAGGVAFAPSAAAAIIQASACATTACALGIAPTTGNVVSVQFSQLAATAGDTVKDSNNVSLTLRDFHCAAANALCVSTWDYLVVGTPTSTFTITATGFVSGHVVEVNSAQLPGEYGGTTAVSGSISSTLTMGTLDQELCYADSVSAVGTPTLVISDGVNIPTIATSQHLGVYAQASANANASCTYTPGTSLTTPGLVFAAYNGPPVTAGGAANLWIGAYEPPPLYFWPA